MEVIIRALRSGSRRRGFPRQHDARERHDHEDQRKQIRDTRLFGQNRKARKNTDDGNRQYRNRGDRSAGYADQPEPYPLADERGTDQRTERMKDGVSRRRKKGDSAGPRYQATMICNDP